MGNFDFVRQTLPSLHDDCARAESYLSSDPRSACFYSRRVVEELVGYLYTVLSLPIPYRDDLAAKINDAAFKAQVPQGITQKLTAIRRIANTAVHENRQIRPEVSLAVLRELFHVVVWTSYHHSPQPNVVPLQAQFDPALAAKAAPLSREEVAGLAAKFKKQDEAHARELAEKDERLAAHEAEIADLKQRVAAAQAAAAPDTRDYDEAAARDLFIDVLLHEAGWELTEERDREYEVTGMPNAESKGYVDYVLWGADGLPLAVVEAKRTSKSPEVGHQQATLYADCLEKQFGRRPVIFYTSGYEHRIWDNAGGYPPRETQGFYTRDELELLIQRRQTKLPLSSAQVNTDIAGRPYQVRAIKAVGDAFDRKQREALLVMATGSGKTRTTIALVDLLQKANWVKRVLFLADRTALVNQAANAFKEHLPGSTTVNIVTEKAVEGRVYVSTYPTMMSLINEVDGGLRRFGPAYFDLIVIDEAHRSVYAKYGAIFDYFDSLLVGLTATPKDEVDHNTYRLFHLEDGVPTDNYSLDEAVEAGYLVPPKGISLGTQFLRSGIKYDDLTEDEKDQWDALDWGEDGAPDEVGSEELNRFLFNEDTVDKVLETLMMRGYKVASGDRLGKTIIFAKGQKHAEFIEKRFNLAYPELAGHFARVITHGTPYAQSLIDDFSVKDKAPHIAISVDMLDTGIDVPEVVNLVFFKMVRSKSKFWQMIGRGTRLCPDLFAPGEDKQDFLVFDFCANLDYFSQDLPGSQGQVQKSLSQRLFEARLGLVTALSQDEPDLRTSTAATLHEIVAGMNLDNFVVRPHRRAVEKYAATDAWQALKPEDSEALLGLAGLPSSVRDDDEDAKRFDLLILRRQLAQLDGDAVLGERLRETAQRIAAALLGKTTIPSVAEQAVLLESVAGDEWWIDVTLPMLELARLRLRGLVRFIEKTLRNPIYTDFEDTIGEGVEVVLPGVTPGTNFERFRAKAEAYLREHLENLALQRLRRNKQLTSDDLTELEQMLVASGGQRVDIAWATEQGGGLGIFIRDLVGLDRSAAIEAFEHYLDGTRFSADQVRFVNLIVDELTKNGVMEPARLFESPYTDHAPTGPDYFFPDADVEVIGHAPPHQADRSSRGSGVIARPGSAEIRLRDIRAHEGSQARAWEELAYQLRPLVGDGHIETRKTRAPDAGVEWYEVYADGHQEGFQAKFHASLADALSGMRESVEAVCTKRPSLTKLTFVVPYDFTDSGIASTKTDQDRWDEAVARWSTDFPAANGIEFATIRAGDITAKLTLKEHAGRREYWFGGLEITDEWLKDRFTESVRAAGERYTPQADSPSSINDIIDAAVIGPVFLSNLHSLAKGAIGSARQDIGMWGASTGAATPLISELDGVCAASFGAVDSGDDVLPHVAPDLGVITALTSKLLDLAYIEWENQPSYDRRNLDSAISGLQALQSLATGSAAKALTNRAFALIGPAGQGKTHALMRAVDGCLERGVPALAILGQRLSDKNWWPAAADTLDGMVVGSDEFLQALDSLAEARRCRALVVIDAINESQSPKRWRDELPALLAQFQKYNHLALVVSFRTDYRDVIGAPDSLLKIRHPGLAGMEAEALAAHCNLFDIPVPSKGLFEPALSSPLFLRMYCEVMAADPRGGAEAPTRSNLFERYSKVIGRKAAKKLNLAPTSTVVSDALMHVADRILDNGGRPVPRDLIEQEVDAFLPGRTWPDTLFQQLASEGLIELRPTYDGTESAAFPFQAYSEHLLADRLMASVDAESRAWTHRLIPLPREVKRRRALAKRVAGAPWSWRSLAVVLPEKEGIELVDLLLITPDDFRLQEAMRESLTDRAASNFGARALELLRKGLDADPDDDTSGVETVLSLAPREGHPGNADWLHAQLVQRSMPDRDATWSIATFQVDQYSDAYRRLTRWAERLSNSVGDEEVRLASTLLMWLFTSPNRFLRDRASKTFVKLLSQHLGVAPSLVRAAQETDDPYVQERLLTCCYGAVLVGGDDDLDSVHALLRALSDWQESGLPIDVIARDSVRGIAAWSVDRDLLDDASLSVFEPPYGAAPPGEPPTREELEADYGPIRDADGNYTAWRASSILHSCLDWMGDFNKYVVKSDVEFFSWYPLSGPTPTAKSHENPLDEVEVNWAGRWIANRAIGLGWTTDRFEHFERNHTRDRGREAHKTERFGKKYQWIAHRELLARLADNFHPSYETWSTTQNTYHGPWVWYGRDFDPTLPPSIVVGESQICRVARDTEATWATLPSPELDISATPDEWVAKTDDLPDATSMFSCTDADGRTWVAIQRYSTWDRDNAQRKGMTKRERDVFFLQFSWLVPRGRGTELYEFIEMEGLSGRWMPDTRRMHHQYLGETASAPIVATAEFFLDDHDIPIRLRDAGIQPRPAVEQYLWEGSTLDCSIDESVDFYAPTPELLGPARWVGHRAEWAVDGSVIGRAIEVPGAVNAQDMLVVDAEWLTARLRELDADMVIATLSERHALPLDDDDYRHMAFSDVWYVALVAPDQNVREVGPLLKVRRRVDEDPEVMTPADGIPDEPFDPGSI